MASNDQVEAITSDPNFEIITTFAYSAGLPYNEASMSHCYLLHVDRMQSLFEEVSAHMLSTHGEASKDPNRRFIVRLAFKRDGALSIMSGPRPNSTDPL
ncbi:aminodeoxychorismate lyase [Colletotrichum graminicola]|nr:aminodeoxychorismate lyase [Colletotrichum graminicola]